MRMYLVLLGLQMIVSGAMAANDADLAARNREAASAVQAINSLSEQINDTNESLNPLKQKLIEARNQAAKLQEQIANNETKSKGSPWCIGSLCLAGSSISPTEQLNLARQRADLQNKLNTLNKQLATYEKQANGYEAKVQVLVQKRDAAFDHNVNAQNSAQDTAQQLAVERAQARKDLADQRSQFKAQLASLKLQTRISEIRGLGNDLQTNLNRIEQSFNDTAMSLYLQAKLQDLMNSPQFCDAQKACEANPHGGRHIKLDALFQRSADSQKAMRLSNGSSN